MVVTRTNIEQLRDEGYFVLERVICDQDLAGLRSECQRNLEAHLAMMEQVGAETLGLSQKDKRYSLACRHEESPFLAGFLFGDLMMEIIHSTVGDEAYLFLELFNVKWSKTGIPFSWHQDSGYLLGNPHKPYISLWCALDDMTEENGALYILPTSLAGSTEIADHKKDKKTNDLVGYFGSEIGLPMVIPSASIVVMSSTTFHCSGANLTDNPRRAFLVSYSPEPITDKNGKLWNLAIPFIKDGVRVVNSITRV